MCVILSVFVSVDLYANQIVVNYHLYMYCAALDQTLFVLRLENVEERFRFQ